jgi:hypothetical protein
MALYPITTSSFNASPTTSNTSSKTAIALTDNTSKILISANADRRVLIVTNPTLFPLYIDFNPSVSSTSFAFLIPKNSALEIDFPWTGGLWGLLKGGSGTVEVRELISVEIPPAPPLAPSTV